ncbi:MAG: serine/threonine-protein kinase [candidate division WOR-3 bacterium]
MKVNNYKILETIKSSSFFKVYKALQIPFGRLIFLKEGDVNLPENIMERFKREAKIAALLDHPNIVKIYETFEKKEKIYHAFEWVNGFDLLRILEIKGKMDERIALLISYEILKALDYAHSKGIIHRDIKPSNVMISKDGFVKLTDFGVAKWENMPEITQPGIVIGTPYYLSPEQVKGEKVVPASDIFSLGILIYEMVFGEKPFKGEDTTSILLKIEKGYFKIPKIKGKKKILRIIKKALEKDKEKRYKNAKEMMNDIERVLNPKDILRTNEIIKKFMDSLEKIESTQIEGIKIPSEKRKKKYVFISLFPFLILFLIFFSIFLYYRISFPDLNLKLEGFKNPEVRIDGLTFYNKEIIKISSFPSNLYRILCEDENILFLKDFYISKRNSKIIIKDTFSDSLFYIKAKGRIFVNSELKDTDEYKGKAENIPYLIEIEKENQKVFKKYVGRKRKIYIEIKENKSQRKFLEKLRIFIFRLFNL